MKKVIIAYMPAIHEGYVRFLQMNAALGVELYLMSEEVVSDLGKTDTYFGRDIRAVAPSLMVKAVNGLKIIPAYLLDKEKIEEFQRAEGLEIVMPTEDVSIEFQRRYLPNQRIYWQSHFLRYDKLILKKENDVSPDRKISTEELDRELMGRASEISEKSPDWWRQVGSVLVRDGKVVLWGYNEHMPDEQSAYALGDPRSNFDGGIRIDLSLAIHSEVNVISEAAKRGISTEGASLYVTVFPCPPCARAVVKAGIKKVYYSKGYSILDAEDILKRYGVALILVKME